MIRISTSITPFEHFDIAVRKAWGMHDFFKFSKEISQVKFLKEATDNSIITKKNALDYKNFYETHFDFLLNTEPIVIKPNFYCERQYRQQAAFLLFQNDIIKNSSRTDDFQDYFFIQSIKDFKDNVITDMGMRIIVKEVIINQLDGLGINEEFLFVELEYTARYIKRKYLSTK